MKKLLIAATISLLSFSAIANENNTEFKNCFKVNEIKYFEGGLQVHVLSDKKMEFYMSLGDPNFSNEPNQNLQRFQHNVKVIEFALANDLQLCVNNDDLRDMAVKK